MRDSPERDISSLHALVDGGWTGLDVPSASAFPGLAWPEYGIWNGMKYGMEVNIEWIGMEYGMQHGME